jgi:hypothetical protein
VLAFDANLRYPAGPAACLLDSYTTFTGDRYVELACLIEGRHPAVVLGAAPPADWPRQAATIKLAIGAARL